MYNGQMVWISFGYIEYICNVWLITDIAKVRAYISWFDLRAELHALSIAK